MKAQRVIFSRQGCARRTALSGLGVTALLFACPLAVASPERESNPSAGSPETMRTHAPHPTDRLDPTTAAPFRWHEALRLDLRPASPVTSRSLVVAPAALVPWFGSDHRVAILGVYRNDQLVEDVRLAGALAGPTLHRFEFGLPSSFRLGSEWAFDFDPRVVHGTDLRGHHGQGWYPWIRAGLSWSASRTLILGTSVLFTRGALGLVPVPLFSLYWRPEHTSFRVDMLAPRYVETAYRWGRLELFGAFHWETSVWAVDRGDLGPGSRQDVDLLMRQEIRLHGGARVRLFGPLGLEASAQWIPWQRLELEDGAGASFADPSDVAATLSIVIDKLAGGPS